MNVTIRQSDAPAVTASHDPYRVAAAAAWGLALAVLAVAYLAIAGYTGNPFPWFEVVHESGDRTLLQTVFFFEHTARELPLDLILGAAVGGCALFACPPGQDPRGRGSRRSTLAIGLLLVIVVIVVGTLRVGGWPMLAENLLQFPTRPGAPREWGGHWRYHLLSHVMLMSVSLGLAAVLVLWDKGRNGKGHRAGARTFGITAAGFAGLTAIFAPNLDPFVDPVFIGHQVRESLTHAAVTVPVAWGTCLMLSKSRRAIRDDGTVPLRGALLTGGAGVLVGLFLLISGLVRSAASQGQSQSLVVLLFPHFFEHSFSYVVAGLTAGLVYVSTGEDRGEVVRR
jgi:hypothetical protein